MSCIYLKTEENRRKRNGRGAHPKEFNQKEKKEERGFPSESKPQGEPAGTSHHRVGARRLEIDNNDGVVWSGGDDMVVWSNNNGGFSLFLSFRSSLSLTSILSLRLDVGFGLLWIFVVGLSDRRGLEIKIGSRDWRSAATAWWNLFFVLILLLGFQFLMETVSHRKLEFFLLGCLICKVSNRGK